MKLKLIMVILLIVTNTNLKSQNLKMCAYKGYLTENEIKRACSQYSYMSNTEAEKVVDEILNNVGLYRNFIIKECPSISNAVAATVESSLGSLERYILYDSKFLERVIGKTGTDWSSISILAHEIGHHLNGHTLTSGMDNHKAELQADEFSGFVLAKMGASMNQSILAINTLGSTNSSTTHPNKYLRIKAIKKGWTNAGGRESKISLNSSSNRIELFSYDKNKSDWYQKKASESYSKGSYNLAGEYYVKAFQYSAGLSKYNLFNAGLSFQIAGDKDDALKYYLFLLKNGIYELDNKVQVSLYKNIIKIYSDKKDYDNVLNFISVARKEHPNNYILLIEEANINFILGNEMKFKELLEKAIELNPMEPALYYNVGVMNLNQKNIDAAIAYFKKAIELKPDYGDAYNNIGATILLKAEPIIEEMNKNLSNFDKYDALQLEQLDIYKEALPFYEKALKLDKNNKSIQQTLIGLYENLKIKNYKYYQLKRNFN